MQILDITRNINKRYRKGTIKNVKSRETGKIGKKTQHE
jgi:hypothetical protein